MFVGYFSQGIPKGQYLISMDNWNSEKTNQAEILMECPATLRGISLEVYSSSTLMHFRRKAGETQASVEPFYELQATYFKAYT